MATKPKPSRAWAPSSFETRPPRASAQAGFTEGSYVSRQAKWLAQAGLAGVEELNQAYVRRLGSGAGREEVQSALAHAQEIGKETGVTPEVKGVDLIELARLASIMRIGKGGEALAERIELERTKLYAKIAQPVGALAVDQSKLAS